MTERERKQRGRGTLLPLLPPPLSFFLSWGNKMLPKSAWEGRSGARAQWRGGGRWGTTDSISSRVDPRSIPPRLPPSLTALICFPLRLIGTRWIRLSSLASLLLPFFLLPFTAPPVSLIYDTPRILSLCGFWRGGRNTKPSLHFTRQRMRASREESTRNTGRPFSSSYSSFPFIFHILFVCSNLPPPRRSCFHLGL